MMEKRQELVRKSLLPMVSLLSVLLLGLFAGSSTTATEANVEPGRKDYDYAMRWREVERLQGEDKYAAAAEVVEEILEQAVAVDNDAEWTRALVRKVQLRTALHGYETAVRILQDHPWPESQMNRAVLELFRAHGLVTYLRAYSWEIAQRELVDSDGGTRSSPKLSRRFCGSGNREMHGEIVAWEPSASTSLRTAIRPAFAARFAMP